MASYQTQIGLTLTDANGDTAQMRFPLGEVDDTTTMTTLAGQVTALLTALGAPGTITNAKVTSATVSFLYEKAGPTGAVDAEYSRVSNGARLNFLNSGGGRGTTTIPAPIAAIFGAAPNEDVVDPTSAVSAFIAWYIAHVDGNGSVLNIYNGGVAVGKHARRRAQHKIP